MSSPGTIETRSIVRSRRVHRAFSLSLAIHLLILAIWLMGHTFHVWDLIPTPPFAKNIRDRLLPPSTEARPDVAKIKVKQPPAEDMALMFVEVDTSKEVKEAPADAKFFAAVNTEAGNPEVGKKDLPKIAGRQTDYLKITENKPFTQATPPPSVAKNDSPAQQQQTTESQSSPAKPSQAEDAKELTQKSSPGTPDNQPPPQIDDPVKSEPENVAQATKEQNKISEPKPIAEPTPPPPNKSTAPDPSNLSQKDSEKAKEMTKPKTEAQEKAFTQVPKIDSPVSETAADSAGAKVSQVEPTPETSALEPEKVTQLASMKPLEPRQSPVPKEKTDEAVIEEILKTAEALQKAKQGQKPPLALAKANPAQENSNQNSEAENSSIGSPDSRPRRLDEVKRASPGEKFSMDGGVQRFDLTASLAAKGTVIGDYTQRLVEAIRQRWFIALDSLSTTKPGKVVLDFRIHNDGRVSHVTIRETSVGELQSVICQTAITDPAPFARWPDAMRNELKSDWRDVTFTFYYLAQ
jgi:hypothetical protein